MKHLARCPAGVFFAGLLALSGAGRAGVQEGLSVAFVDGGDASTTGDHNCSFTGR